MLSRFSKDLDEHYSSLSLIDRVKRLRKKGAWMGLRFIHLWAHAFIPIPTHSRLRWVDKSLPYDAGSYVMVNAFRSLFTLQVSTSMMWNSHSRSRLSLLPLWPNDSKVKQRAIKDPWIRVWRVKRHTANWQNKAFYAPYGYTWKHDLRCGRMSQPV
jgi:hypothetical protein